MKLGGKENGRWRTEHAKAYPPKMCRILAQQHIFHAMTLQKQGRTQEPEGLEKALQALANSYDPYLCDARGTKMCADYNFQQPKEYN